MSARCPSVVRECAFWFQLLDWIGFQAALKTRHPDSLPVLIAAAKPSPQESAIVTELQTKLQTLQVWPCKPA